MRKAKPGKRLAKKIEILKSLTEADDLVYFDYEPYKDCRTLGDALEIVEMEYSNISRLFEDAIDQLEGIILEVGDEVLISSCRPI